MNRVWTKHIVYPLLVLINQIAENKVTNLCFIPFFVIYYKSPLKLSLLGLLAFVTQIELLTNDLLCISINSGLLSHFNQCRPLVAYTLLHMLTIFHFWIWQYSPMLLEEGCFRGQFLWIPMNRGSLTHFNSNDINWFVSTTIPQATIICYIVCHGYPLAVPALSFLKQAIWV